MQSNTKNYHYNGRTFEVEVFKNAGEKEFYKFNYKGYNICIDNTGASIVKRFSVVNFNCLGDLLNYIDKKPAKQFIF